MKNQSILLIFIFLLLVSCSKEAADGIMPTANADVINDDGSCISGFSKATGYSNLRHKSAAFCIKDAVLQDLSADAPSSISAAESISNQCTKLGFEMCTKLQVVQAGLQGVLTLNESYNYVGWHPGSNEAVLEYDSFLHNGSDGSTNEGNFWGYCCYR